MITKLFIENYRSIQKAELPLGKINILTGANNSGKSSVIYAALTLRNFVNNPNQSLDAVLSFPFIDLGGYEKIIYDQGDYGYIKTGIELDTDDVHQKYHVNFSIQSAPTIWFEGIKPYAFKTWLNIAFPYSLGKSEIINFDKKIDVSWNGLFAQKVQIVEGFSTPQEKVNQIEAIINTPTQVINSIDFIPPQRIFSKTYFSYVPINGDILVEEQVASLIARDNDLERNIAYYFDKIVGKKFIVERVGGVSYFYLKTVDKQTGFTTDLVNEGTGINQLVTILAKTLKKGSDFICIDEPEIHLHPTYISRLAKVLVEIAENENKQFLISTHSEHLVSSLLNLLITKDLKPDDLHVFYCSKKGKTTEIEQQEVNDKGQIAGGFKSFIDAEMDNLATLFKIAK